MKLKPLAYRSLEELERQINQRDLFSARPLDDGHDLIERFTKINKSLKADIDKNDQEKNYLNYRKLLLLYDRIKNTQIFKDRKYCDLMLGKESQIEELKLNCTRLRAELTKRYDSNKVFNLTSALSNSKESNPPSTVASQADYLTCVELIALLEQLSKSKKYVLLIDLRRKDDFERSCIRVDDKLAACLMTINIPEDRIKAGCTCQSIESVLSPNDLNQFRNRNQAHTVVLMDYESSTLKANDKLFIFHQALSKFDVASSSRLEKEPVFLKGGFSDWLITYPMFCTDAAPSFKSNSFARPPSSDEEPPEQDDLMARFSNIMPTSFNSGDAVGRIFSNQNKDRNQTVPGSAQLFRNPAATSFTNNLSNNFGPSTFNNRSELTNELNKSKTIYHKIHLEQEEDDDVPDTEQSPPLNSNTLSNNFNNDHSSNFIYSKPISAFKKDDEFRNDNASNSFGEAPSIFSSSLGSGRRSKSYTNLSEMPLGDESEPSSDQFSSPFYSKPSFDRSNKPTSLISDLGTHRPSLSASVMREFSPIYGTNYNTTGLKNLGNTCFMNAVIQCLFNVRMFSDYFISENYLKSINANAKFGTKGELAEEFGVLLGQMDNRQVKHISPKDFRRVVGRHIAVYSGCEQQDSHEFLLILFEKLHADLNRAQMIIKPPAEIPDNLPSKEAIDRFWMNHVACNNSIISNLFEGLIMSTLECDACQKKSNTFEVFSCLSLPIPNNNFSGSRCDLEDCLREFTKNERMCDEAAWQCPTCKVKRPATKKTSIVRLPKVLIIHLKRFSFEGRWKQKITTFVDFPMQNLNLRHFISFNLSSDPQSTCYDLTGIVDHTGSLEGGHYTAICRSSGNAPSYRWNKFDDQDVNEISQADVVSSKAYLLFYVQSP